MKAEDWILLHSVCHGYIRSLQKPEAMFFAEVGDGFLPDDLAGYLVSHHREMISRINGLRESTLVGMDE